MKSWIKNKVVILVIAFVLMFVIVMAVLGLRTNLDAVTNNGNFGESSQTTALSYEFDENDKSIKGMILAASSDGLKLYVNRNNAEFALKDEVTGNIWYSNPQDRNADILATGDIKSDLESQLIVDYYDKADQVKRMNTAYYSIAQDNFTVSPIENGFKIGYTLGKPEYTIQSLPRVVESERFEELILLQIDEDLKEKITKRYKKVVLSELESIKRETYQDVYPDVDENTEYYLLNPSTPDYEFETLYDIIYNQSSYGFEDLKEDNEKASLSGDESLPELIYIPLEITLKKSALNVSIPCEEINIPDGMHIKNIEVLPYFGASSIADTGYMFVPDGSGALIHFNNGKTSAADFKINVYGEDTAISKKEYTFDDAIATIPVFAQSNIEKGFWAVITEGDAHALVNAQISGVTSSYNRVFSSFNIQPTDTMTVKSGEDTIVTNRFQEDIYKGNITVLYNFTGEKNSSYSDFAVAYRDYLEKAGDFKKAGTSEIPFVVEFLGTVKSEEEFCGVPYTTQKVLTSYAQANKIVSTLKEAGISAPIVKYTKWYNHSSYGNAGRFAKLSGKLGGSDDYMKLEKTVGDNLYLNTSVAKQYDGLFDFNYISHSSKYVYNENVKIKSFHIATLMENKNAESYYLLSPRYFESYLGKIIKNYQNIGTSNIWIEDAGEILYSDFAKGKTVDRQMALEYVENSFEKYGDVQFGFNNPNKYLFKYTDVACNIPQKSSGNILTDEDVPFLSIVLSGSVSCVGKEMNLSGDLTDSVLKAAETGSGLHFKWIYEDNEFLRELEGNEIENLYSLNYSEWINEAITYYKKFSEDFKEFQDKKILSHEKLSDFVYKTSYENGYVIVNYSENAVNVDNLTVEAKDYLVKIGG